MYRTEMHRYMQNMVQLLNTNKIFTYVQGSLHKSSIYTYPKLRCKSQPCIPKKYVTHEKKRSITLQPTHVCDRIFIFLIAALRLLAFISNLFLPSGFKKSVTKKLSWHKNLWQRDPASFIMHSLPTFRAHSFAL
jgi:hypothetical protein